MPRRILWFRRDLRLRDLPALTEAAGAGAGARADSQADAVLALFVVDPALWNPAGAPRRAWLVRSLRALDDALQAQGGRLHVRHGDPVREVARVAREVEATSVHVSGDAGVYGRDRDRRVEEALRAGGVQLRRAATPYAVAPGTVRKGGGEPYGVFTPFERAWARHGWPVPAAAVSAVRWLDLGEQRAGNAREGIPGEPTESELGGATLPEVGENAALDRWQTFRDGGLRDYDDRRNRPDLDGTSQLSAHLKYGEIHPRTILADLAGLREPKAAGAVRMRTELAWREFYADVLWHRPETARHSLRPEMAAMRLDDGPSADERFAAWAQGRTGFPLVDAGMRQLLGVAWMHNRVRMVAASFLVKDLHIDWTRGAAHFMAHLRDGDLASNNHGWQWVAGTGTDASPYYRVFNPVKQGLDFDPEGDYVRRWVPELRGVPGRAVHSPWELAGGIPTGYPERIVDHASERREALDRFAEVRGR